MRAIQMRLHHDTHLLANRLQYVPSCAATLAAVDDQLLLDCSVHGGVEAISITAGTEAKMAASWFLEPIIWNNKWIQLNFRVQSIVIQYHNKSGLKAEIPSAA